jgi:tetratricopeptide (TPR) repeat protein
LADIDILRGYPAVVALAHELAAAVLEYADFAISGGGSPERVIPHLRALTSRDPLDEPSRARLMMVLATEDRQAEALQIYQDLRQRLDEQMGVLPGAAVQEAHARILRHEFPDRGEWAGLGAAHGPWTPVCQLPPAPADFTGRSAGCDDVIGAVTSGGGHPGVPLVAISGPPGVGKTTLALYAAHKVRDRFPDGQLWVELAGSSARPREPGDVLGEILRALGVSGPAIPGDFSERAVAYRSQLAGKRILVVVDDAATAAQLRLLTPGTSGCALLVTSRVSLEGLDGAHLIPLEVMSSDDAASLLTQIVGPSRVGAEPDAAADLVRACGALPLALRIVGAKLAARPHWPLATMVRRISGSHDRLSELQAGDLSVRASIASSYESLPERLRRAFRLLALLGPSDFAEWVVGALLGEPGADDVIIELTGRSLLTPLSVDATGEPRYRLHDLLRDYAAERLAGEPVAEKNGALGRLLTGWLQLAQQANSHLPPEPYFPPPAAEPSSGIVAGQLAGRLTADPIAWFTAERINLRAAVEQACQLDQVDLARQLAHLQGAFQYLQDRYDDAELLWRMIADSADRSGDRQADAVYAHVRSWPGLGTTIKRSRSVRRQLLSPTVSAWLRISWRRCTASLFRACEQGREIGNARSEGVARGVLADAYHRMGEYDLAAECLLQAIPLFQERHAHRYHALSLLKLGIAYEGMGRYPLAVSYLEQSMILFRQLRLPYKLEEAQRALDRCQTPERQASTL